MVAAENDTANRMGISERRALRPEGTENPPAPGKPAPKPLAPEQALQKCQGSKALDPGAFKPWSLRTLCDVWIVGVRAADGMLNHRTA